MPRLARLRVRGVSCRPGSPRLAPFPPPPPHQLPCSAASSVLRGDPTSHARTSTRAAAAFPGRPDPNRQDGQARDLPVLAHEDSLHATVLWPRGVRRRCRAYNAAGDVAFRSFGQRRHPETLISRLHSPACRFPYPTLRRRPRGRRRMVGATVVRYSFGVGLFHSLLHPNDHGEAADAAPIGMVVLVKRGRATVGSVVWAVHGEPRRRRRTAGRTTEVVAIASEALGIHGALRTRHGGRTAALRRDSDIACRAHRPRFWTALALADSRR